MIFLKISSKPGWQYKVFDHCFDGKAGWWWLEESDTQENIMAVSTVGIIHDDLHPDDKVGVRPCIVLAGS